MAKLELRERAIEMRKEGISYSKIRETIQVSKSTLSNWLREYPLSRQRINELRGNSEQRIERCRETKAENRNSKQLEIYKKVGSKIGSLSERELFLAGILLYWAEGTKASSGSVIMTNTDPQMLKFFISWILAQGIMQTKIRIYLHLYSDMDISKEINFWSNTLGLPLTSFRKPRIKEVVEDKRKNYKGRFGHGTCNIIVHDVTLYDLIMNGIAYIKDNYGMVGFPKGLAV